MSLEDLEYYRNRTRNFKDSPNVVEFLDGEMITTLNSEDTVAKNSDYNAWKTDTFRKLVIVWDTNGIIVDSEVNLHGSFHDSKISTC